MNDVSIQEEKIEFLLKEGKAAQEAGDMELALQCFDHCDALEDQTEVEHTIVPGISWVRGALFLYGRGDYENAAAAARRALDCRPEASATNQQVVECAAHHIIGDCERHLGNLAEAEAALRAALEISEETMVLVSLCRVLVRGVDDRDEEALCLIHRALEIEPDNDQAHYCLGILHYRSDDYSTARMCFERALELDRSCGAAHWGIGWMIFQQALSPYRGDPDLARALRVAEQHLRKATQLEPEFVWGHIDLGRVLKYLGRAQAAAAAFRGGIAANPASAEMHYAYGNWLRGYGFSPTLAEKHLRRAAELCPEVYGDIVTFGTTKQRLRKLR